MNDTEDVRYKAMQMRLKLTYSCNTGNYAACFGGEQASLLTAVIEGPSMRSPSGSGKSQAKGGAECGGCGDGLN